MHESVVNNLINYYYYFFLLYHHLGILGNDKHFINLFELVFEIYDKFSHPFLRVKAIMRVLVCPISLRKNTSLGVDRRDCLLVLPGKMSCWL